MRLLILFLFALSTYAEESVVLSGSVGASAVRGVVESYIVSSHKLKLDISGSYAEPSPESQFPQSALYSLLPKKTAFTVEYGNGVLTNRLEEVTLNLLEYPLINTVVGALSDQIETVHSKNRIRFVLDVNRHQLKLAYLF